MMKVRIIALGKIKEAYLRAGLDEYLKRMTAFGGLEILELADEKIPERPSEKEISVIKKQEGEKVLSALKKDEKVICLTLDGKLSSSEELASQIADWTNYEGADICFVIGGSLGLSPEVQAKADLKLGFGRMTLPHQLMRLVLTEQIYRIHMINRGSSYHK